MPSLVSQRQSFRIDSSYCSGRTAQRYATFAILIAFCFYPGDDRGNYLAGANKEAAHSASRHGLVLTCIGDAGGFHYKKSRRGDAEIDRAMAHVLRHCGEPAEILEFSPYGYDERQYCSPGFNLPVGCLMRSVWGTFPEYHTSADNLDFIQPEKSGPLASSVCHGLDVLENNRMYLNQNPLLRTAAGEARSLSQHRRGTDRMKIVNARLWVLNLSDGEHDCWTLPSGLDCLFRPFATRRSVLRESGLLAEVVATS